MTSERAPGSTPNNNLRQVDPLPPKAVIDRTSPVYGITRQARSMRDEAPGGFLRDAFWVGDVTVERVLQCGDAAPDLGQGSRGRDRDSRGS
uniref:Transposase n=1 Tax=Steinernema glaseri TaxID=37863 RepID=A0A1I8ASU0_9BILA